MIAFLFALLTLVMAGTVLLVLADSAVRGANAHRAIMRERSLLRTSRGNVVSLARAQATIRARAVSPALPAPVRLRAAA